MELDCCCQFDVCNGYRAEEKMTSSGSSTTPTASGTKKDYVLFFLAFLALGSVLLDVILRRNEGITVESVTRKFVEAPKNATSSSSGSTGVPVPFQVQIIEDEGLVKNLAGTEDSIEPEQRLLPETTSSSDSNTPSVSLVVSFFAVAASSSDSHPHVKEIKMSILNNLHNPHFQQVVVILDSATQQSNCSHFQQAMVDLEQKFMDWLQKNNRNSTFQPFQHSKLTCVDRPEEQPSYLQMFQYAINSTIVKGPVVVLANADHAFDDTAQRASQIKETSLVTLSSWGFNHERMPQDVVNYLEFVVGRHVYSGRLSKNKGIRARCKDQTDSWDGYLFHQQLLQGKQLQTDRWTRQVMPYFRKDNRTNQEGKTFFRMNEIGAENAALWALMDSVPQAYDANACRIIKLWHFHVSDKMHAHPTATNRQYWKHERRNRAKRLDSVPFPHHIARQPYENAFVSTLP
ncbi:expressed unknown protein [Seminavis robusta]|uniref:Uncharacterized protein n=1 Tax=Seminavis robusta TaxID=568900 RepID=A0A9N8DW27_9STRA|nr:expressed unknown protein [Seminavis robusta]|eukprot:Sro417_g138760.1 n/a (459) ;mRNA; f:47962-49338